MRRPANCRRLVSLREGREGFEQGRDRWLINDYDLPREAIPTQWLNEVAVWDALVSACRSLPGAQLGKMTATGLVKPFS